MRLKNLNINPQNGKIEINLNDLDKPFVIIVSEGRARMTILPPHGETKVITYQGKVKRIRFDEGEEF